MLGTSDAWSTSHSFRQTSEPACYIVDCLISDPKLYAPISVTVHFMAVNSGGGRGVCIHASNSSSGDPLLTAGVGEQP